MDHDLPEAARLLREVILLYRQAGSVVGEAGALNNLANLRRYLGVLADARIAGRSPEPMASNLAEWCKNNSGKSILRLASRSPQKDVVVSDLTRRVGTPARLELVIE